jgi:5-oxoprolinase (ATP-hydrolysing) subunit A
MHRVDLNCDMGESFGNYVLGNDRQILDFVTSANIACGYHAGDPSVMRKTARMALDRGVAIGAHPSYPDLQGFGRRFMTVSPQELNDMVLFQIGALAAIVGREGGRLQHVKAHGALYNAAAEDRALADAIASAVRSADPDLILFGLSDSELLAAGARVGLRTASEGFADRTYQADGTLRSRGEPGALIEDPAVALEQSVRMVVDGVVRSHEGTDVVIKADTICIHGDGPRALEFARTLCTGLADANVRVAPIGAS